jgi:hypothetical protein
MYYSSSYYASMYYATSYWGVETIASEFIELVDPRASTLVA